MLRVHLGWMSASSEIYCKTLLGSLKTNFPGCGRGDRIIVPGFQNSIQAFIDIPAEPTYGVFREPDTLG
jgi:hypothetical protein